MPPAWPEGEYLELLGKVVYAVASLEGMLIFDLQRMPTPVAGLSSADLSRETTTNIGKRLASGSAEAGDETWVPTWRQGARL